MAHRQTGGVLEKIVIRLRALSPTSGDRLTL